MNSKQMVLLKRLVTVILAFALIFCESNWTIFATTYLNKDAVDTETIIVFNADGSTTYDTVKIHKDEIENFCNTTIITEDTSTNNDYSISSKSSLVSITQSMAYAAPYRYGCLIYSIFPDGTHMQSTGTLVRNNIVLVSAHGVYNNEYGGKATTIYIAVGAYWDEDNNTYQYPNGSVLKDKLIITTQWVNQELDRYDWALLTLPVYDGSTGYTSHQSIGYAPDYTKAIGRSIQLIGYPDTDFCFSNGDITGTTDYKLEDRYKNLWVTSAKSEAGMSGGAMIDTQTGALIGIIKGQTEPILGKNCVVPLTEFAYNTINQYAIN